MSRAYQSDHDKPLPDQFPDLDGRQEHGHITAPNDSISSVAIDQQPTSVADRQAPSDNTEQVRAAESNEQQQPQPASAVPATNINPNALTKPESTPHAADLIEKAHAWGPGHWGPRSIRKRWDMHGFSDLIDKETSSCEQCLQWTNYTARYAPFKSSQPEKPFDVISFDLATGFLPNARGYTCLLVVVCNLTKYVFVRALKEKSATEIGIALFSICIDFGFPREIQCDNEPVLQAVAKVFKQELKTQHRQTVEYVPRTNSNAETAVKLASTVLHKITGTSPDWDLKVPICQLMINDRVREDENLRSPFEDVLPRTQWFSRLQSTRAFAIEQQ
jgi:hypothetical protein